MLKFLYRYFFTYHRDRAPAVQRFALDRFAEIDVDHDGILSETELLNAQEKLSLTPEERKLLSYLFDRCSYIGHIVATRTIPVRATMPMGLTIIPPVYVHTYNVYGISRDDLRSYPQRA